MEVLRLAFKSSEIEREARRSPAPDWVFRSGVINDGWTCSQGVQKTGTHRDGDVRICSSCRIARIDRSQPIEGVTCPRLYG